MKPIFRGLTIAVVGDLGGNPSWTDTNITRWVELRKGRFVREMSDDVTHVLCSKEEFKRMGPMGASQSNISLRVSCGGGVRKVGC